MNAEMTTLTKRGTRELVELHEEHRPMGVKWVFKVKTNDDDIIECLKARLIAYGFTKVHI